MLAEGQTAAPAQRVPITATNVSDDGVGTVQFRGNVQITVGNTTVVADEADLPRARFAADGSPNPIQLRGNVRMTFGGSAPVIIEHR